MRRNIHSFLIATTVGQLFLHGNAMAARSVSMQIEAQPISSALGQFVQQSGLQVLFPADESMPAMLSVPVVGKFTPDAALSQLLSNSGLRFEFVNAQTIAIRASEQGPSSIGASSVGQPIGPEKGSEKNGVPVEESDRGIPEVLVTGSRSLNADIERTQDDIQPYVVIDRKMIERSTATNVNDLLRSNLTMSYVAQSNEQALPTLGGGNTSTVSLRGLSSSQTLILIDGRRAGLRGNSGVSAQADLNGIPISAIERIEVLPATASGIYGGSATGGVVNVVLRRNYSGVETALRYEDAFRGGGAQRRVDMNGGFSFNGGRTSVMFSGGYSETNELLVGNREFYSDYVRQKYENSRANNPQGYLRSGTPVLGATTNISSVPTLDANCFLQTGDAVACRTAPNLILKPQYGGASLGSPITHVPAGYAGVAGDGAAGLVENAGTYNLDPPDSPQRGGLGASLLNGPTVQSLSTTLRHAFGTDIEAFLTLGASRNLGRFTQTNIFTTVFSVAASAPNNPFTRAIRVSMPFQLGSGADSVVKHTSARALAGVKFQLANDWSALLDYSVDRSDLTQSSPPVAFSSAAAAAAIGSGAFNVLVGPPEGGFNLSEYVADGTTVLPSHSILSAGSARIAGPVISMPAGPLVLTALLEHNKQSYSEFSQAGFEAGVPFVVTYSEQSSTAKSVYLEAQVPIVSEVMEVPALKEVSFQVAGRYDSYRNIGGVPIDDIFGPYDPSNRPRSSFDSFDPTIGMRFRPFKPITIRASYGTGFLPPSLHLLNPYPPFLVQANNGYTDPKRGNEPLGEFLQYSGGSPNLKPEQSTSKSVGVILTPPIERLRLSFDWTRIRKRDNISTATLAQQTFNQEDLLPGVVLRDMDPASFGAFGVGPVIGFNGTQLNATRAASESYDIAGSYVFDWSRGTFELYANATRLVHNEVQLFPAAPSTENAGTYSSPNWQANASVTWNWRALSATWSTKYLDDAWLQADHAFNNFQNADRLPAATYHDVAVQYRFNGRGTMLSAGSVQFGVKNVFDKKPRFAAFSSSIYDTWTSPMLATYFLSVSASF